MNFNLALLGKQRQARTRRAISLSRCPPVLQQGEEETGKGEVGRKERDRRIYKVSYSKMEEMERKRGTKAEQRLREWCGREK